jgi:hypothetical protein
MIRLFYKDGTVEEYHDVNASFENTKFRTIYFMKDEKTEVVTFVPIDALKSWEDDHSGNRVDELLKYASKSKS